MEKKKVETVWQEKNDISKTTHDSDWVTLMLLLVSSKAPNVNTSVFLFVCISSTWASDAAIKQQRNKTAVSSTKCQIKQIDG